MAHDASGQPTRRDLLLASVGVTSGLGVVLRSRSSGARSVQGVEQPPAGSSTFGRWTTEEDLPAFLYAADQEALSAAEWDRFLRPPTRRHWLMVGNRALQLQQCNDGTVGLFDESEGLRWLLSGDEGGSGVSVLRDGDVTWGSAFADRPPGDTPQRLFAPTWFTVRCTHRGLALERTLLCPEGEVPWVLVRVRLSLAPDAVRRHVTHEETWSLRPRFLNLLENEQRRTALAASVRYRVERGRRRIDAYEIFPDNRTGLSGRPAALRLEALGVEPAKSRVEEENGQPTLRLLSRLNVEPGATHELWFRFGRPAEQDLKEPGVFFARSLEALHERLPRAQSEHAPTAEREVPWHAAILTGGACRDAVLGGHTLNQGSAYSFEMGFNGAARDPLQHALPLVYSEPDLALSVLRNTLAWGSPDGDLPYALSTDKQPAPLGFRPSDTNLWALWLAAEYAAATGDLAAFDAEAGFHPSHHAAPVTLRERLSLLFRFFVDQVGRGARDHVRILNADWNDIAIARSGVTREEMVERGSSVLNSAMASWVLGTFAGLAQRLGEQMLATEARQRSTELRTLVQQAHNGRWFHRAYAPDGEPVGDDACWLEVQPWAILCGAAESDQAQDLLRRIDEGNRKGSPLGARLVWPLPPSSDRQLGEGVDGGMWFAISMTLVWAAARVDPELAWDEWRRMSLDNHARHYPDVWEGTLSGPDSFNAPESPRPGRTWQTPLYAMQAFPVNNLHAHAQPLLAYLRLLGVEPTPRGTLAVGSGGSFRSRVLTIHEDGGGRIEGAGELRLETAKGAVSGRGVVSW